MIVRNAKEATNVVILDFVSQKKVFSATDVIREVFVAFPQANPDEILDTIYRFDLNRLDKGYDAAFIKSGEYTVRVYYPFNVDYSNYVLDNSNVAQQFCRVGRNSIALFVKK